MKIGSVLRDVDVFLLPEGITKWKALRFMVYSASCFESYPQMVLESLERQEAIRSSGLVNGFAIPHCIQQSIQDTLFLFGFSKAGIPWVSYDRQPAHFVFLLVRPPDTMRDYLRIYRKVFELMEHNLHQEMLVKFSGATFTRRGCRTLSTNRGGRLILLFVSSYAIVGVIKCHPKERQESMIRRECMCGVSSLSAQLPKGLPAPFALVVAATWRTERARWNS